MPKAFTKKEIDAVFKIARTQINEQGLEIRLAPCSLGQGRILIITPRAVGNAPKRNRIRRRLKSIFYEEKLFEQGFDWIVLVRKPAIDLKFATLKEYVLQALKKATNNSDRPDRSAKQ